MCAAHPEWDHEHQVEVLQLATFRGSMPRALQILRAVNFFALENFTCETGSSGRPQMIPALGER